MNRHRLKRLNDSKVISVVYYSTLSFVIVTLLIVLGVYIYGRAQAGDEPHSCGKVEVEDNSWPYEDATEVNGKYYIEMCE